MLTAGWTHSATTTSIARILDELSSSKNPTLLASPYGSGVFDDAARKILTFGIGRGGKRRLQDAGQPYF
jgi:hypothetical protein